MRVAHVVHHYGHLSESFIPDALEELERAGAEGWVATMSVEGRETYPFPPTERLLVCPLPSLPRRALDRARGRSGIERFAAQAAARLCPHAPAIVHAQFGWAAPTGVAVARRLGVPAVATFHGTDVTVWQDRAGHPYRQAFDALDAAIAVSDFIADSLRRLRYGGPIEIIPAGVRLDRLPFRNGEPEGDPRILYVGRLTAQKGLAVLLRAMPRIVAAIPAVRLEVIGGGDEAARLERLATDLGIGDRVLFRGALRNRSAVFDGMRQAHVLAMPSRAMPDGQAEGSPVVTKEAQAIGVAVVATATGGIAETVPPEHRADLVPGDDPAALAAAVIALLGDPGLRRERARRAREWVASQFAAAQLARRTVALYERLGAGSAA
jgi:glycosyltransferase involved in cell wall biosynthesis